MTWAVFERRAYQAARKWGVQPSEFWKMSVTEWWAEFDSQIIETRELRKMQDSIGSKSKTPLRNRFSEAQWEEARARHKAKMNGRTGGAQRQDQR